MPVTAPTSSAMVTTRIARLILTFQLVKMVGTIAGSISLTKNCQRGRPERAHHVAQFARHAAHGVERIDQEHRPAHHHQHEADAEFDAGKPQHREQNPRHHRHRHQNADHRVQIVFERLRAVHRHRQRHAEHERGDQRADHARQRHGDVERRDGRRGFSRSSQSSGSRTAECPDRAPDATAPPRQARRQEGRRESAAEKSELGTDSRYSSSSDMHADAFTAHR